MKNKIKNTLKGFVQFVTKNRWVVSGVCVFLFLFGWYGVRPAVVKHICSWVTYEQPIYADLPPSATSIVPMARKCEPYNASVDDAKYSKWYNFETGEIKRPYTSDSQFPQELQQKMRDPDCNNVSNLDTLLQTSNFTPQHQIGEKKQTREASKTEYQFCIQNYGL